MLTHIHIYSSIYMLIYIFHVDVHAQLRFYSHSHQLFHTHKDTQTPYTDCSLDHDASLSHFKYRLHASSLVRGLMATPKTQSIVYRWEPQLKTFSVVYWKFAHHTRPPTLWCPMDLSNLFEDDSQHQRADQDDDVLVAPSLGVSGRWEHQGRFVRPEHEPLRVGLRLLVVVLQRRGLARHVVTLRGRLLVPITAPKPQMLPWPYLSVGPAGCLRNQPGWGSPAGPQVWPVPLCTIRLQASWSTLLAGQPRPPTRSLRQQFCDRHQEWNHPSKVLGEPQGGSSWANAESWNSDLGPPSWLHFSWRARLT